MTFATVVCENSGSFYGFMAEWVDALDLKSNEQ